MSTMTGGSRMASSVQFGKKASGAGAPAVAKAIDVISYLDSVGREGAALSEIARNLGLTKSHCYKILQALTQKSWVEQDSKSYRYQLSALLLSDVRVLISSHDPASRIHEEMLALVKKIKLPCMLSKINADGSFTIIDRVEDEDISFVVNLRNGYRFAGSAPAQLRARLAALTSDEARETINQLELKTYTKNTLLDKPAILREADIGRERGYVVVDGEFHPEVTTIASAISTTSGPRMILHCPGLRSAVLPHVEELGRIVAASANNIAFILNESQ